MEIEMHKNQRKPRIDKIVEIDRKTQMGDLSY